MIVSRSNRTAIAFSTIVVKCLPHSPRPTQSTCPRSGIGLQILECWTGMTPALYSLSDLLSSFSNIPAQLLIPTLTTSASSPAMQNLANCLNQRKRLLVKRHLLTKRMIFGRAVAFGTFQAANTPTSLHKVTRMMLCPLHPLKKAVLSPRLPWNADQTSLPRLLIKIMKASTLSPISDQPGVCGKTLAERAPCLGCGIHQNKRNSSRPGG